MHVNDITPDTQYANAVHSVVVQVAIGIGDLGWAQQCFKLAAVLDPTHVEALTNLGVLELRRGKDQQVSWEWLVVA
jgi:hypothetical protein